MRILKWGLIVLIALALLLGLGGMLLSPQYAVQRSVTVGAPADKVYGLINNPREWRKWTAWNERDPQMEITYSGPEAGAGAGWAWTSRSEGSGSMRLTEAIAGQRVAYELHFPEFDSRSTGALTLTPIAGGGVDVVWSINGDMGANPLMRWMGLAMDSMIGKDFARGLARLKAVAEAP